MSLSANLPVRFLGKIIKLFIKKNVRENNEEKTISQKIPIETRVNDLVDVWSISLEQP